MACGFVFVDGLDIPGVDGITLAPQYVTDSQRTLSGMLRVEHTAVAREWRIELRGVTGDEMSVLYPHLVPPPTGTSSPREVTILGATTTAMVTVDQVRARPKLREPRDLGRSDLVLTVREILPAAQPIPPVDNATADSTNVTADTTQLTADTA